jgi:hypothetical protein
VKTSAVVWVACQPEEPMFIIIPQDDGSRSGRHSQLIWDIWVIDYKAYLGYSLFKGMVLDGINHVNAD